MIFDHSHYVPCLRWKQGEYQAVLRLSGTSKNHMTPLIEVPEIGFDFETGVQSKSVDEHLAPFAKRVKQKWGVEPCFVDLRSIRAAECMSDGQNPVEFVFNGLRTLKCAATPVTGISRGSAYEKAVGRVTSTDKNGLCVRLNLQEAAGKGLKSEIVRLLEACQLKASQCDLVLDLGAPNFVPIEGFTKLVSAIIGNLPYLTRWRTFSLCATSFPPSMAEIKQGHSLIPRLEWELYRQVINLLNDDGLRLPAFGDYAINHPDTPPQDMRLLKPSATIRYTTESSWLVVKGSNVRDNKFDQYRDHCQTVIADRDFSGPDFSYGDRYIAECAVGTVSTGNLTTWRMVGTNHHLERVVRDIASLFGS